VVSARIGFILTVSGAGLVVIFSFWTGRKRISISSLKLTDKGLDG
jgi:hypothetical protein